MDGPERTSPVPVTGGDEAQRSAPNTHTLPLDGEAVNDDRFALESIFPSRAGMAPSGYAFDGPEVETDTMLALDLAQDRLRRHLESCPDCLAEAPRCAEGYDLHQRVMDLADELAAESLVAQYQSEVAR